MKETQHNNATHRSKDLDENNNKAILREAVKKDREDKQHNFT